MGIILWGSGNSHALVELGTSPDVVEDPTSAFPRGQTAANLESRRGHKGVARYLAEAHLSSHLYSLSPNENVMDSVSANIATEKATQMQYRVLMG